MELPGNNSKRIHIYNTSKHMFEHRYKQINMESYIKNCIDLLLICVVHS